jgi:trigger factor
MSFQIEKKENSLAVLTIEVPAAKLDKAIEKAYQNNKSKLSAPGFRKGKVPRAMIEKLYGVEVFYDEAADELIAEAYEQAVEECGEEIVSSPKIDVVRIEAGQPFVFTAEVALKPDVGLGKYKGVKIPKQDSKVSDEEIDAALEREREKSARNILVEDRPVQDGDMTILDFEGFLDNVPFDGGKGEDYALTIGSGTFIPGFEEQLIGAEIGQETEVNVSFPEDYHADELAGKPVVFKCTVKEIKEKELPELDDEFAAEVSEFDTLKEYRADLAKKLGEAKEAAAKEAKEDAVINAIVEDSDIIIPQPMLETQKRQVFEDFARNIERQGMSMEQYLRFTGMDVETMLIQMEPQAEKRIKSRLVLEAIAAAEGFDATEADFEEEVTKMADMYKMEPEKVKEMLGEKGKKQVMKDIVVGKAVDFAVENAKETK